MGGNRVRYITVGENRVSYITVRGNRVSYITVGVYKIAVSHGALAGWNERHSDSRVY